MVERDASAKNQVVVDESLTHDCPQCGKLLGDHPWRGESGEEYCTESCVERAGDKLREVGQCN